MLFAFYKVVIDDDLLNLYTAHLSVAHNQINYNKINWRLKIKIKVGKHKDVRGLALPWVKSQIF